MTDADKNTAEKLFEPTVDIIIGNKNGHAHLVRCLEFVYLQRYNGKIRTTVVDNKSDDSSIFAVTSQYPQVSLIKNEKDVGLAAALNQALAETKARCILFLSADVELRDDYIRRQVEFLRKNPDLAGAASLLCAPVDDEAGERIDSAGINLSISEAIPARRGMEIPEKVEDRWEVFAPSGAAAFWDREAIENIAPNGMVFDEDMNVVYIDLDLAWRARWLGLRFACNPHARGVHNRGAIYSKYPVRRREMDQLRVRNLLICYRKNLLFYGWSKFGKLSRKLFRKQLWEHLLKFGAISALGLWIETKWLMFKAKNKGKFFQGRVRAKPEAMYGKTIFKA
jgi:GT2 family glycosyltransferase